MENRMGETDRQANPAEPRDTTNIPDTGMTGGIAHDPRQEAAKAIRFMLVKAAIFILIPVIASALAVYFLL